MYKRQLSSSQEDLYYCPSPNGSTSGENAGPNAGGDFSNSASDAEMEEPLPPSTTGEVAQEEEEEMEVTGPKEAVSSADALFPGTDIRQRDPELIERHRQMWAEEAKKAKAARQYRKNDRFTAKNDRFTARGGTKNPKSSSSVGGSVIPSLSAGGKKKVDGAAAPIKAKKPKTSCSVGTETGWGVFTTEDVGTSWAGEGGKSTVGDQ